MIRLSSIAFLVMSVLTSALGASAQSTRNETINVVVPFTINTEKAANPALINLTCAFGGATLDYTVESGKVNAKNTWATYTTPTLPEPGFDPTAVHQANMSITLNIPLSAIPATLPGRGGPSEAQQQTIPVKYVCAAAPESQGAVHNHLDPTAVTPFNPAVVTGSLSVPVPQ